MQAPELELRKGVSSNRLRWDIVAKNKALLYILTALLSSEMTSTASVSRQISNCRKIRLDDPRHNPLDNQTVLHSTVANLPIT